MVGGWKRPDLPPGPLRDLNQALHDLRDRSGLSTRQIATAVQLRFHTSTPSHTTVHQLFSQSKLQPAELVLRVVEVLLESQHSLRREAHETELDRFDRLWRLAADSERQPRRREQPDQPDVPAGQVTTAAPDFNQRHLQAVFRLRPHDLYGLTDSAPLPLQWLGGAERADQIATPQSLTIEAMPGDPPLTLLWDTHWTRLPPGSAVDRYGEPDGNVCFALGTPYEQRSLPPSWRNRPYHAYQVLRELPALAGLTTTCFDQPGRGSGFVFRRAIADLVADGSLVEIDAPSRPAAERWPEDERDAALALTVRSEPARAAREAAAGLDAALDCLHPPPPTSALAARVRGIAAPPERRRFRLAAMIGAPGWAPVAAGVVGVALLGALWMAAAPAPEAPGRPSVAIARPPPIVADETPALMAGIAIVDPLTYETDEISGDFAEPDLGADGASDFTRDGGMLVASGGLSLE